MPPVRDGLSLLVLSSSLAVSIVATIYWSKFVNDLLITAHSSQPQDHWIDLARNKAYGLCYNGCGDSCLYPGVIADACAKTAQVNLPFCDAREIWFWADRYPDRCLEAVGKIYEDDAVWWRKFWLRGLYLMSFIFVGLAFGAMFSILDVLVRLFREWRLQRTAVRRQESTVRAPLLPPRAVIAVVAVLAILASPVVAYPCPNYYPPYNRHFANADGTVYGVAHGWLSDCFDEAYECGKSCTTASSGGEETCTPLSCTRSKPFMLPINFVEKAAWRVEKCGFKFVDAVPGVVDRRIPNPRIEGKLWVKVAVNRFNVTEGGEERLDEGVRCLYEMI